MNKKEICSCGTPNYYGSYEGLFCKDCDKFISTEAPGYTGKKQEDFEDTDGLVHSYVASRKLANRMNVAVTLHYKGLDYTVKPTRLGEKVNKQKEQIEELRTTLESQQQQINELTAALEFYSINKNYENQPMGSQWSMDGGMAYRLSEIMQDKGKIAQVALTSIKE